MRLLHTTTLKLHSFIGKAVPPYVILSHRWEEEEVLFQDLQDGRGPEMPSFSKIKGCCTQARKDGWQWAWIDTCCIDKSSSAELSEAINSMYRWYSESQECYAHLSDVDASQQDTHFQLQKSAWFTRGWTLQELLAPTSVVFFDHKWIDIGTKSSLQEVIVEATAIRPKRLFSVGDACIAEKMSWAAERETTRIEDEAYCLMGLFDVNMPLLYGEGRRAFQRLQHEIIKSSDDYSFLSWVYSPGHKQLDALASSPHCFRDSGDMRSNELSLENRDFFQGPTVPHTMTNKGLHLSLFLTPLKAIHTILPDEFDTSKYSVYLAVLSSLCNDSHQTPVIPMGISMYSDELAQQKHDWRVFQIPLQRRLFVSLRKARTLCRQWQDSLRKDGKLQSGSDPTENSLWPATRHVYLLPDPDEIYWHNRSLPMTPICTVLLDITQVLASGFSVSHYSSGWHTDKASNLTTWLRVLDIDVSDFCFTHESFFSTIVMIVNKSDYPRPMLTLLVLPEKPYLAARSLLRSLATPNQKATLDDRVSLRFMDDSSISASVRRFGGPRDYEYVIKVVVDKSGAIPWMSSSRLTESNARLIKAFKEFQIEGKRADAPGQATLPLRKT